MQVKLPAVYQDHLTYPILIVVNGRGLVIVEMLGADVNRWNRTHGY